MRLTLILVMLLSLAACAPPPQSALILDHPSDPHCSGCGSDEGVLSAP